MYICDMYEQCLKYHCRRYSNNSKSLFSDEEILTIYLFVGQEQKQKYMHIHKFIKEYPLDRIVGLISYLTFVCRLNWIAGAVKELSRLLLASHKLEDCDRDTLIVDSMSAMTCTERNRKGKVATEIIDKRYCSTKKKYYYRLKLYFVYMRRKGYNPFPCQITLSSVSENDLAVFMRECIPFLDEKTIFTDKIYSDAECWETGTETRNNSISWLLLY